MASAGNPSSASKSTVSKQDPTGKTNDEHEGDKRRLPNEKPNHGLLPVFI